MNISEDGLAGAAVSADAASSAAGEAAAVLESKAEFWCFAVFLLRIRATHAPK